MTDTRNILKDKTILLSTGGTGGHIFPAVATAHALRKAGANPVFVTNFLPDHLNEKLADFPHHSVPATPISGAYISLLKRFFILMAGLLKCFMLSFKLKPALVIGYGGYSTFGPLNAAIMRRTPFFMHEQNAVAGKANIYFLPDADGIALTFPDTTFNSKAGIADKKGVVTGNPVRAEFFNDAPRAETDENGKTVIFITGGSQAAAVFAYAVPTAIGMLSQEQRATLKIVQQCREEQREGLENHYKRIGVESEIASFFSDMPQRLSSCAFVIARAGASTLCEIAASATPSILVPYMYAAADHQRHNALFFHQQDAALVAEETLKDGLNPETLAQHITALLTPETRRTLSENIKNLAMPDAAENIADMAADVLHRREAVTKERSERMAAKKKTKK